MPSVHLMFEQRAYFVMDSMQMNIFMQLCRTISFNTQQVASLFQHTIACNFKKITV